MSNNRGNDWNSDPNNFSNTGGPDAGFGGQQQQTGADTSTFGSDQFSGSGGQNQGQGNLDNNLSGGGGGFDRAGRGDTLGDQYQTSAGAGDNYGSTGYPGNTTGTDSYGAGNVDQFPGSGAGAQDTQQANQFSRSSGGVGGGGGRGFGDGNDYDQSQYDQGAGTGNERSTGQKIKGECLT
ncbi:hypothetical protein BD311DRAFT_660009 [Dichomitus squalens]|uniref:Uncharacterized protein n=1 Tax=Dichomitus squalens TaxID=114155 RepID=A0A4Q9MR11_9APHY|nr:hypothetical protein BD311DRAFT_660009 [Dichomitus squalens]